jgi:nucleoside-diphosphate-sugar epimerase
MTVGVDAHEMVGLALRYGTFYGPGTGIRRDGEIVELVQRRKLPLVGPASGVWSFCHIDDAADATLLAASDGPAGVYNIVDDEPAPVSEWLPVLATAVGAKPPRHVPTWLARLLIGEQGISVMTQIRGSSNAKARRGLGWTPRHPSWRTGFAQAL